ncbi:amidohydrolase family protein [Chitinophaga lutea]
MIRIVYGLLLLMPLCAAAQEAPRPTQLLINDVEIFNGRDNKTVRGNVLITGNVIGKISTAPIATDRSAATRVINGQGKFLMPGLIDAHYHAMFAAIPEMAALTADIGFVNIVAAGNAKGCLQRGFTSIRDMGGPIFGLKKGIDMGLVDGPRIWPSGAFISQTGGHGDFRLPYEVPSANNAPLSYGERMNASAIADGKDAVLKRSREQLMLGASQLKLMAGGGVSSVYDPLDVSQYTEEELHAAVEAARNWGTYVTVHAYTSLAVQTAIKAGVLCIEHGQMVDEATAKMIADKGIWWCLQPFIEDEHGNKKSNPASAAKQKEMYAGTDHAMEYAKKYKAKIAWGTDALFNAENATAQGLMLTKMLRWFTPFEVLRMATYNNGQVLQLSGKRSPYAGKIGVLEEGALADVLLVDGNALQNIKLLEEPAKNLLLIIKDGVVYKDLTSR